MLYNKQFQPIRHENIVVHYPNHCITEEEETHIQKKLSEKYRNYNLLVIFDDVDKVEIKTF